MAAESAGIASDSPLMAVTGGDEPDLVEVGTEPAEISEESVEAESQVSEEGLSLDAADADIEAPEISGMDDLESIFDLPEDEEESESSVDELDDLPEEVAKASPKAQNRWQTLANRAKTAESRAQELEAWSQTAYQQFQAQQQQMQVLQTRLAELQGRLGAVDQYGLKPQQQQEPQDPIEKARSELINDITAKAEERLSPRIQQLEQMLEQSERQRAELEQANQRRQRQLGYRKEADEATSDIILRNIKPEHITPEMKGDFAALATAWAYGRQTSIPEAAKEIRGLIRNWSVATMRSSGRGPKVKATQSKTSSPAGARAHGAGTTVPTTEQAQKMGASDPLEAMMARDGVVGL